MKKKLLVPAIIALLVLALVLALVQPWGTDTPPESTPETTPSQPSGQTTSQPDATSPKVSQTEIPDGIILSEDRNLLIAYHAHYDVDIYPEDSFGESVSFRIRLDQTPKKYMAIQLIALQDMSLREIAVDIHGTDAEQYSVYSFSSSPANLFTVASQTTGQGAVGGTTSGKHLSDEHMNLAMTLAGIDWNHALELYTAMTQTDSAYCQSPSAPGNLQRKNEARAAYLDYLTQYQQLAGELDLDAPDIHSVLLSVDLSSVPPGTVIEECTLTVGKDTYLLPLGQIRFRETQPAEDASTQAHDCLDVQRESTVYARDDGFFSTNFAFRAKEAMILDRIEVLDENGTVIGGAWIQQIDQTLWQVRYPAEAFTDETAKQAYQSSYFSHIQPTYWPNHTPFYVNAGDLLCIRADFFSPALAQAVHHQGITRYALHYTAAGGEGVIELETELTAPLPNAYELYYTYLENLDLSAYYHFLNQGGNLAG